MNNPLNFFEYTVKKKREGIYRVKRIIMILTYITVAFLLIPLMIFISPPLLLLVPIILWILIIFTWRYVNIEFEYSVLSGTITVSKIYGRRARRLMVEAQFRDMRLIAPVDDRFAERIKAAAVTRVYDASSSINSPDTYFCLFEDNGGKSAILYFEANIRTINTAKSYNRSATVMPDALADTNK